MATPNTFIREMKMPVNLLGFGWERKLAHLPTKMSNGKWVWLTTYYYNQSILMKITKKQYTLLVLEQYKAFFNAHREAGKE